MPPREPGFHSPSVLLSVALHTHTHTHKSHVKDRHRYLGKFKNINQRFQDLGT